jgi:hypothetical protein|tara:strand:- start:924 stop:1190 length:267 start_codon:yes stop_codon:yes gene_type:complete
MNRDELSDEWGGELLFLSEEYYDKCVVGVVEMFGRPPLVCYDKQMVLDTLVEHGIENPEEALEYFEFNIIGAWVGESTPVFLEIAKLQ